MFPFHFQVRLFGSSASLLGAKSSDMDCCLIMPRRLKIRCELLTANDTWLR